MSAGSASSKVQRALASSSYPLKPTNPYSTIPPEMYSYSSSAGTNKVLSNNARISSDTAREKLVKMELKDSAMDADSVKQLYRGLWFSLHLMAARARTPETKAAFRELVEAYKTSFPCERCKRHFRKYTEVNPLDQYESVYDENGIDVGYAKWTWMLHNNVNRGLAKPYMDWDTFSRLWLSDEMEACSKDCGK
jgi:hypothetical protein